MATYRLWYGRKSASGESEYADVELDGEETGFWEDADDSTTYRFFQTDEGNIVIHKIERTQGDEYGTVIGYNNAADAINDGWLGIMSRAGAVKGEVVLAIYRAIAGAIENRPR